MPEILRVHHLRGIVMRAPAITDTTPFYLDQWGLHVAHEADGVTYLRGTGSQPFIYGLKNDATYGIEYIHFGMPDRASTDALFRQLQDKGADLRIAVGDAGQKRANKRHRGKLPCPQRRRHLCQGQIGGVAIGAFGNGLHFGHVTPARLHPPHHLWR